MTWVDFFLGALIVFPISWIAAVFVKNVVANRGRPNLTTASDPSMARDNTVLDGRNSRDGQRVFWGLVILGVILWLVWVVFVPEPWRDTFNYSSQYHIQDDHIHFTPKPKDCDWGHAPIGDKACHYKKQILLGISRDTAQGRYMDEETYRKAVTGKGLYDAPAPIVTDVYIDWEKIEEQ
jgi:hypothetical protein